MTQETLPAHLGDATLVFQGRVVSVGIAPNAWSSMLLVYQPVTWRIEKVYRGDAALAGTELVVRHLLVMGSKTARRDPPGLDPDRFAAGAEWVVLAKDQDGQPTCVSENDGVVPPTAELQAALAR